MAAQPKIQIFRQRQAKGLLESGIMNVVEMTPEQRTGMKRMVDSGYIEGDQVKVLVNIPGFSLTHAWLKKDYPLLLHSHDSDCLYHIVAGDLQLGTEALAAGDSFYVPAGAAYQYRPGPQGVEILEYRHAAHFDFRNLTKNQSFYEKGAATVAANRDGWRKAKRPSAQS